MIERSGLFVVLDGVDGSGKTTQVELLARRFREINMDVVTPREPGGTPLGEKIRELLLLQIEVPVSAHAQAFLFSAARAQLYERVIRPALAQNKVVLMDRSFWSTLVYQGEWVNPAALMEMIRTATFAIHPDICVFLDISPETAITRSKSRAKERFKKADAAADIVEAYRQLAIRHKVPMIPGEGPIEEVTEMIWKFIEARL